MIDSALAGTNNACDSRPRLHSSEQILRRLRLATGLIMFSYVLGHFLNHSLGNVSLAAMQVWLDGMMWLWRNPIGGGLLYAALLIHALLGLWSLYNRRHLRMPAWEALQLISGLLIPALLLGHVVGTRLAYEAFAVDTGYPRVLTALWVVRPDIGIRQLILMSIVWLHACIGIHFWLRFKPAYPRAQPWLLAGAILVPVLALLGYVEAGRDIALLAAGEDWFERLADRYGQASSEQQSLLRAVVDTGYWVMGGLLLGTLVARLLRQLWSRRHGSVRLRYAGGQSITVVRGTSILEASRAGGLAHASVCGGRGRCSTCRVRVGLGGEHLPPPDENESRVLQRIQAPPNVRLACQTRPRQDLDVTLLLPADSQAVDAANAPAYVQGIEREVAILFVDLRGSTRLIEDKLPYDVVFILNRFFAATTAGMERAGGHFAQFAGDGMMGLFGAADDAVEGARAALAAARYMHENLDQLNRDLASELNEPLCMGIGLHAGLAIVGAMGNPRSPIVTAIGDSVNVAARLEGLCKDFNCEAVVSRQIMQLAGIDAAHLPLEEVQLRGRNEILQVYVVADATQLTGTAA